MKTILAVSFIVLSSVLVAAEEKPTTKKIDSRQLMAQIAMKRYGGKIRQPNTESGAIVFVNTQKTVEKAILKKALDKLDRQFKYIVKISDKDVVASSKQLVVRLEDLDRAERILLAPESYWVSVNVKSLAADNPPKAILADRFEKEVRRAFAFVCGGTCGTEPGGICRLVNTLSDLDAIPGHDFALDIEARIVNNMHGTDVKPYRVAKYSEAVQEGWAPAPTNEFQKAIWNKVHASPKNPIKIEFDPKRGR